MSGKYSLRKFVSVDPAKCTGCGICELACSLEKNEHSPLRSRIRVVQVAPLMNFALTCRACKDAPCVDACAEKAIEQDAKTGLLSVNDEKCAGCDWCVVACEHGGITIESNTGLATVCDLCGGNPQCVEFCPEQALELVDSDEAADKRLHNAFGETYKEVNRLVTTVKNRDWGSLMAASAKRDEEVTAKLDALRKKAKQRKK